MTLDLLDLLFVSHFCFNATVPVWLWIAGALMSITSNIHLSRMYKNEK